MLRGMSGDLFTDRPTVRGGAQTRRQAAGTKLDAPAQEDDLAVLSEREETASICRDAKGNPEPDPELRDTENVPLGENIDEYVVREVLPYVPDAWVDLRRPRSATRSTSIATSTVRTAAPARGDRG